MQASKTRARSKDQSSVKENIVELEQVISKVNKEFLGGKYEKHKQKGTLDTYYNQILTSVAADMIVIPVQREIEGLEPLENPHDVLWTLAQVADVVSTVFGKPFAQVQKDLMKVVEQFPANDFRKATFLRHNNKLH